MNINKILHIFTKQRNTLSSCRFIAGLVTELSSFSTRAHNPEQFSTKRQCDTFDCLLL